VRVTFANTKKGSQICTGLNNAWFGGECLMGRKLHLMLMGPWHFAQGKASLGNTNQPTDGAFFCVIFTFLDLFLPGILPLLTKQDWVRFSFGPHICTGVHHTAGKKQTGSEIMSSKVWHKPREKDCTELITLAADQKVDPESMRKIF
jgi:hypothetical protein